MAVLGLTLSHDTGAALFDNGKCVFAINEERLNREKMTCKFPALSIRYILEHYCSAADLEVIALQRRMAIDNTDFEYGHEYDRPSIPYQIWTAVDRLGGGRILMGTQASTDLLTGVLSRYRPEYSRRTRDHLAESGLGSVPVESFDHHECHAAAAYYGSGFGEALVVSMDGHGDGYSCRAYLCRDGEMRMVAAIPMYHSLAVWYQYVTQALGYRPNRHEGKVTGLAAYGKVSERFLRFLEQRIRYVGPGRWIENRGYMSGVAYRELRAATEGISPDDIAHTIQHHTERVAVKFVEGLIDTCCPGRKVNLAIAGGLFANVKLNGSLFEMDRVERMYVFANMGDGGNCVGAAYNALRRRLPSGKGKLESMPSMLLGPEYAESALVDALQRNRCDYVRSPCIEAESAALIHRGAAIGRFAGREEFGPRALGNRSILVSANKSGVKDRLNRQLERSHFMPFAPILADVDAEEMLEGYRPGQRSTYAFMTLACQAKLRMQDVAPYAVHVDGSVRPQVVAQEDNATLYRLLLEYRKLAGHSVMINTSFNIHEEPIICSPDDAIRSFRKARLDYLVMGDYLAKLD